MFRLPLAARLFVITTIAAGVVMLGIYVPHTVMSQPLLLLALLLLSSATAALKVHLPLTTGGSTMSVSYAVDFAALLLIGPHETMIVAATSALCQCTLNSKDRNPFYRTLFSMASLVVTVQGAGLAFHLLGGQVGAGMSVMMLARPLVGAATVYFL